ncbi:MAG: Ldh family oxidoreductase [Spirochaetales bacterium]|nr:Ldh family oxidoreductase [Spirochaetales bacterium]
MEESRRYGAESLAAFSNRCLEQMGVPSDNARTVTDCLLYADRRGHASHGIVRLPVYGRRVVAGVVNARARASATKVLPGIAVVDGDNALGPVAGAFAMQRSVEIAREDGFAIVTVKRSNHFGSAAFYNEIALEHGYIGVAASNAPPNMAPFGGKDRFLGTNPLSVAIPTEAREPILFDMASSVVARGKIILAAQQGKPIPEGWALDPNGNPTTDAHQGLLGPVLPFGGAKGSAISLLIDILAGVLSGASYGRHLNTLEDLTSVQNLGHFFLVIDPERFMGRSEFLRRMDDLIDQLKATPTAPGFHEILAPGEIERRTVREIDTLGIPVAENVVRQLRELGESLGVDCDFCS